MEKYFSDASIDEGDGIIYMEFGNKKQGITCTKGEKHKKPSKKRKGKEPKRFDNQITVLCRSNDKVVNMKLFKNGNVQMTGIKFVEQGVRAVDLLIENIKRVDNVVENPETLFNTHFKIQLINSDFKTGLLINREKINKIIQNEYNLYSCFEHTIYPGVKVQYFWQHDRKDRSGACECKYSCNGKGNGLGDGDCKKITIAIFQSGCIIITGAREMYQIDDAYKFICRIISTHYDEVIKKSIISEELEVPKACLTCR